MRFDEKPKRRIRLKKSRAELPRESSSSRPQKSSKKFSKPEKLPKLKKLGLLEEEPLERAPAYERQKPEKLPEGYDVDETFAESLKSSMKNHLILAVSAVLVVLVVVGFATGTFQKLFSHNETEETVAATTEDTFLARPKTVFTQGKFDLNVENTDAGVDIICETTTDEEGNEKKTCRAKTEEDRKKEEEEKEREEQEKKAAEEREQEEKEAEEAKKNKKTAATTTTTTTEKQKEPEGPVKTIGITNISGCPAEATADSVVILKASVLPSNAENQNIIWSTTSSASVVYEGAGNTATVTVGSGERVIVTAMSVDGGYSEHCIFQIVDRLTE
ncbi:hypothetical protein IJ090_02535 [Candidatus Saccharibacteria bacterium]|nr:hypothetical protein [Candidatus Saccharibacteria bacterium]